MKDASSHRIVMFADISGSSRLYKQRGNTVAQGLITAIFTSMRGIIDSYHGSIIKTIGDEIMATLVGVWVPSDSEMDENELLGFVFSQMALMFM